MSRAPKHMILLALCTAMSLSGCGQNSTPETKPQAPAPIQPSAPKPISKPEGTAAAKPVDRGAVLYRRCRTCHTLEQDGRHKVGPNLWNIVGAKAGTKDGFNYSQAMKASNITWTDENFKAYIENPRQFMPGNRMTFAGLRKAEDLEALLQYMKDNGMPKAE